MSDIAIVGIDCRFPQAPNPAALWQLLLAGADGIAEVPENRWAASEFFDPGGGPGKANTVSGGFLADADAFDHEFFAIPPREAEAMDPQQRLLLQTAWRALEDATLDPRSQAGSRTGVFVGVMANEWAHVRMRDYAAINPQLGMGNGYFMTANRLSYQLDLKGPSIAVDTACSSSLVAVHLACQALRNGECDQALAGGVNMIVTPALGIFYTQAGLSAPDGRCKPFSGAADGIGRGEGVAVVVLRRLRDAVAEGLPIYAVIKAGGVNADGRSNGIAAPNRWSQQELMAESCARARVDPAEIAFLEAHGTGTLLGDMIEVKALGHVHGVPRAQPCAIGSIKGNLGHTEGAAGLAGLIKAAFALHHGVVPPSRYAEGENARLRLAEHGLRLLDEPLELPATGTYAAVSSFGLGGSNAHVVLASAPAKTSSPGVAGGGVFTLSAASRDGLRRNAAVLAADLAARPPGELAQLCWTSNRVKASGRHRLAIPAREPAEAVAALRAVATDEQRLRAWSGVAGAGVSTGWLFTGQGSQYPGMSRALHESSGAYRRALAEVDEAMSPLLGVSVREVMLGDGESIHQTRYAQPAIFAVQYAISSVLLGAGIEPAWLVGHSVGEYAAAAVAGVFGLDEACLLIAERGRLMQALPQGGGMLGVRTGPDAVDGLLAAEPEVDLAAINGPDAVVLSGSVTALARIDRALANRGVATASLPVSHAFHSPLMEPVLDAFARTAAGISYRQPRIPVYSTLRGRLLGADEPMDAAYWTEQIRAVVRFADAVTAALDSGATHLLEVGPRRVLASLVRTIRPEADLPCLVPCPGERATGGELAEAISALYRDGLDPVWDALYEPEQRVRRRLPGYEFAPTIRSWIPAPRQPAPAPAHREPGTPAAAVAPASRTPSRTIPNPVNQPPREVPAVMENVVALFREQAAILSAFALAGSLGQPSVPESPDARKVLSQRVLAGPPGFDQAAVPAPARSGQADGHPDDPGARAAATVIEQVARISGFPAGTLERDRSLVTDLGFDSIMGFDLVNSLRRNFPEVAFEPDSATMSTTLGDLIDYVAGQLGAGKEPTVDHRPAEHYRIEEFPEVKALADRLALAEAAGVANPYFLVNDGITRDTSIIGGREVVNFSSYNYLGMSGHPAVTRAVQDAVATYGSSCSASRVISGEKSVHRELEAELAAFLGTEDAIAMVSGHATNVTVIGHLAGPGDLIVHDSLAHDSILQGAKLSGATRRPFPHNDHAALDVLLRTMRHQFRRVLILMEGVYSQDGDIPDLPAFIQVKKKHQALLMIDEAHSIGVIGATGRGIGEYFGVRRGDVELWSGTMSKALAGCGGYVAGSDTLIRFLKYTAPGFVYSVGMTPPNAAASLAALRQIVAEPEIVARLQDRGALFLKLAKEAGLDTGDSEYTPVIPCILGDSLKTVRLSNALLEKGINVNPILYPAVPEELTRLRFFVTVHHTDEQIRYAVDTTAAELATLNGA